eukprot:COSAG06_NODE_26199_length_618_cov_3.448077_1_plen_82_part_00
MKTAETLFLWGLQLKATFLVGRWSRGRSVPGQSPKARGSDVPERSVELPRAAPGCLVGSRVRRAELKALVLLGCSVLLTVP